MRPSSGSLIAHVYTMVTTALYHWKVAGSPVEILIDLPLVDRLRVAATSSDTEIGGLLLGHFDGNYTVITDFDPVECEHRRGTAFTLSQRDEQRLGARIEARRKRGATLVGFFRSHLRPGMFLDEGDNSVLSSHFNAPSQVALLIRPSADRTATGGFFFWEEGEMNRKQTYLAFPMNSRELELGDFPLVEPVASPAASVIPFADFDSAETIDSISRPAPVPIEEPVPVPIPVSNASQTTQLPEPRRYPTREIEPVATSSAHRKLPWPIIGLIAAGAAFGGYLIGTSGSHSDRFGARSGDMTVNSAPEPQPVIAQKPYAPAAQPNADVVPALAMQIPPAPVIAQTTPPKPAAPKPAPALHQPPLRPPVFKAAIAPIGPAQPTADQNSASWQHFHPPTPAAPAQVAETAPVPPPVIPRTPVPSQPTAESSVSLESVESGTLGRAFGKIPFLHHARSGENFVPPQAVSSFAPKVPHDLARELTGPLPVDLKLTVDKSGRVSSVEIISHQTPTEFVRLAGDAAYDWKFEPARLKDKPISSDVIAHFRFRPLL